MNKYVFDGQVYAQRMTGQYRYADEILMELDKIINKDEFEIIVPEYVDLSGKFKNIKVIHYGKVKGIMWTQISLAVYLIKNKAVSVGFCNTTPIIHPGIAVIHDIGYKVLKDNYKNMYGRLSSLWHRLNYWVVAKSKMPLITVSEFSKKQIEEIYHISGKRIIVIGNAWQHYNRIQEDESIFHEYKEIIKGKYYFALGSLEERKNFKWIVEVAKRNPNEIFVIAGGAVKNSQEKLNLGELDNMIFLGYISDERAKSLMKYARAFLFPSKFEGFGIPPLEALSVGTKSLCANSSCLPEIYKDSVAYFGVDVYNVDLHKLLSDIDIDKSKKILNNYSWTSSAADILELIRADSKCEN